MPTRTFRRKFEIKGLGRHFGPGGDRTPARKENGLVPQQDYSHRNTIESGERTLVSPRPVEDKSFVFTGKLAAMPRSRARSYVEQAGGTVRSSVSRVTNYLVVGEDGWPLEEGEISRKLELAQRLHEQGGEIKILTERQWLELLGLESKYPHENQLFSAKACCRLLKIDQHQLRAWRRLRLVEPVRTIHEEELYNFQDLKTLRTLNDLVARGMRPTQIRNLLRSLESVVGDMERPLAQLTILAEQGRMVVRRDGEQLDYGGQLWLDFEPGHGDSGLIVEIPEAADAWELYWEAEGALAHPSTFERGLEFLERGLSLEPDFGDIYCLAGTLHFAEGRIEQARASFEKALELEPTYAEAWYHLGHILDRYSNWLGAVRAYKNAIDCDPDFEAAHFHLALLYEEAGDQELAQGHWCQYLEVATEPEWISIALKHIKDES